MVFKGVEGVQAAALQQARLGHVAAVLLRSAGKGKAKAGGGNVGEGVCRRGRLTACNYTHATTPGSSRIAAQHTQQRGAAKQHTHRCSHSGPWWCTSTQLGQRSRSGQVLSSQRMWQLRVVARHHSMSPHTCGHGVGWGEGGHRWWDVCATRASETSSTVESA